MQSAIHLRPPGTFVQSLRMQAVLSRQHFMSITTAARALCTGSGLQTSVSFLLMSKTWPYETFYEFGRCLSCRIGNRREPFWPIMPMHL